jgi:hypothetical protein
VTIPIRPNGAFSVSDAPMGSVRVAVETTSMLAEILPGMKAPRYVPILKKYGNPETSGLTADIEKQDGKPVSIELKSR